MAILPTQTEQGADLLIPQSRSVGGCLVLRPIGPIDSSSVWKLRQVLAELQSPCRVVLDLSAVSFIDSAGLGAVIGGLRRIRELGGDLNLAAPRSSISRVFAATGMDRVANVYNDLEDAVAGHRQPGGIRATASSDGT